MRLEEAVLSMGLIFTQSGSSSSHVGEWGGRCLRAECTLGFGTDPDPSFGRADRGCHSSGCPLRFPVCPFREFLEQREDYLSWPDLQQHWVMGRGKSEFLHP